MLCQAGKQSSSFLVAYILVGDGRRKADNYQGRERISGQDKGYENHSLFPVSMGLFLFVYNFIQRERQGGG